jgi:hypothetical protein
MLTRLMLVPIIFGAMLSAFGCSNIAQALEKYQD